MQLVRGVLRSPLLKCLNKCYDSIHFLKYRIKKPLSKAQFKFKIISLELPAFYDAIPALRIPYFIIIRLPESPKISQTAFKGGVTFRS